MRPIILKSAGIVGLAGVIMAIVSSNALFVDPGGPPRASASQQGAAGSVATLGETIIVPASGLSPAPAEQSDASLESVPPTEVAARELAVVEPVTPEPVTEPVVAAPLASGTVEPVARETTAVVIPAPAPPPTLTVEDNSAPAEPPAIETASVSAAPADPAPVPLDPAPRDVVVRQPETTASVTPAAVTAAAADTVSGPPADQTADRPEGAAPEDAEALWPKDAVECPRDWVASLDDIAAEPDGCETIASLVRADETPILRKTLPEAVLDLVALAPPIPVPGAKDASEDTAQAKPEEKPKPKPVKSARRSDWPAGPPPDCGGKHAYWHFVDRKTHTKEWYCR